MSHDTVSFFPFTITKSKLFFSFSYIGDIICQLAFAEEDGALGRGSTDKHIKSNISNTGYDVMRTLRFTSIGTVLVGPVLFYWYGFLARTFTGHTVAPVLKRLAMDQLVFAPLFIPTFMTSVLVLEGKNTCAIKERLQQDYLSALRANYTIWPPAMFFNFWFVPLPFQVLFSNSIGLVWNVFMSFITHKKEHEKLQKKANTPSSGGELDN